MKVVSSEEMKNIEGEAIYNIGIPSLVLMEMAASKFTERCFEIIENKKYSKIVVFAGKGNNGGDGLAFFRQICQKINLNKKIDIEIIFVGDKSKASDECKTQLNILFKLIEKGFEFKIHFMDSEPDFDISNAVSNADLIVDAIIGTGLKYNLRKNILDIVKIINKSNCAVAAIDCPTGIDSDSGKILGDAVMADFTVTFHLPKIGLLVNDGAIYSGKLFVEDINIPYGLENHIKTNVLTKKDAEKLIPKRAKNGNKGTFGKVFIFAGCDNMPGACVISSKAAYRAGAGLVCACSVKSVCDVVKNILPESVTKTLPSKNGYLFSESINDFSFDKADCIVIGPGLGNNEETFEFVKKAVENLKSPVIIDADALNVISKDLSIFHKIKVPCIITPHLGEMSRLIGKSIDEIKNNIIEEARIFSKKYGVITVLKDFRTVISNPSGETYINTTGSSSLGKGGSGDCLTGVAAAFIAQGLDCFSAGVLGTYILGYAGEKIAENYGEYGALARECADFVSISLKELQ